VYATSQVVAVAYLVMDARGHSHWNNQGLVVEVRMQLVFVDISSSGRKNSHSA
jgi:hypothetical protein